MNYPQNHNLEHLARQLIEFANLKSEYEAKGIEIVLSEAEAGLKKWIEKVNALPNCPDLAKKEPDALNDIKSLRPEGIRRIWNSLDASYAEKLEGALLARSAGCTLGAIVEGWSVESMEDWAKYLNFSFPPTDYWPKSIHPNKLRYGMSLCEDYTSEKMNGIPVDDDMTYTILGMLIAEDYGVDFTIEDVGKAWVKYLPCACTAEEIALQNLKKGIPAVQAADIDNPYCQWIGADIRSDPWAYIAPGYPEKAAELAWRDAYLSHRRNGIYGAMYFAAAQSAAFAVDNAVDALKIALSEIPSDCILYHDIVWALNESKGIKNYKDARAAVDARFKGMHFVHTNNNAALTVFGLIIGENDVTKTLSEIVAMGLDNDCTAATAGSIVGAIAGKKGIPEHWYKHFNNKLYTYMIDQKEFAIDHIVQRFTALAEKIM